MRGIFHATELVITRCDASCPFGIVDESLRHWPAKAVEQYLIVPTTTAGGRGRCIRNSEIRICLNFRGGVNCHGPRPDGAGYNGPVGTRQAAEGIHKMIVGGTAVLIRGDSPLAGIDVVTDGRGANHWSSHCCRECIRGMGWRDRLR